jgi:hypothetical protein
LMVMRIWNSAPLTLLNWPELSAALVRALCSPQPQVDNQHPDHGRLGRLVRDVARLARYGGLPELRDSPPHSIKQLFFYVLTIMDYSSIQIIPCHSQ